jgi:hypothetical protein
MAYDAKIRLEDFRTGEVAKFQGEAKKTIGQAIAYMESKDGKSLNTIRIIIDTFRKEEQNFHEFWSK